MAYSLKDDALKLILDFLKQKDALRESDFMDHPLLKTLEELVNLYSMDAPAWLADMVTRSSEDEPLKLNERFLIFYVCGRVVELAPSSMSKQDFARWTYAIMTIGYLLHKESYEISGLSDNSGDKNLPEDKAPEA